MPPGLAGLYHCMLEIGECYLPTSHPFSSYSGLTPAMHFSLETSSLQGLGSVFAETWGPVAKVKSFLAARDERSLSNRPAGDQMWAVLQSTVLRWQGPQAGVCEEPLCLSIC